MMFAAFIGGWELILILLILGGMVSVALVIGAVLWMLLRQHLRKSQPPVSPQQHVGH